MSEREGILSKASLMGLFVKGRMCARVYACVCYNDLELLLTFSVWGPKQ